MAKCKALMGLAVKGLIMPFISASSPTRPKYASDCQSGDVRHGISCRVTMSELFTPGAGPGVVKDRLHPFPCWKAWKAMKPGCSFIMSSFA